MANNRNITIKWPGHKAFDHSIMETKINFIKSNMNGLLPLYEDEISRLRAFAKTNNFSLRELFSLRNQIRTQKEIESGRYIQSQQDKIKSEFIKLYNQLILYPADSQKLILDWFKKTKYPVRPVIKIIGSMPEFRTLDKAQTKDFFQIIKDSESYERIIRSDAQQFEVDLAQWLREHQIKFITEDEIRASGKYTVTPDILLDEPIIIQSGNQSHLITWIDAKNYVLADVKFINKKLIEQSNKYNRVFGFGAFVFHYGFDKSIDLPGVVILDGSVII
jgi:hypothetical protein